jgi:septal ring factor EnvC (AmiA/AmiB activator)
MEIPVEAILNGLAGNGGVTVLLAGVLFAAYRLADRHFSSLINEIKEIRKEAAQERKESAQERAEHRAYLASLQRDSEVTASSLELIKSSLDALVKHLFDLDHHEDLARKDRPEFKPTRSNS